MAKSSKGSASKQKQPKKQKKEKGAIKKHHELTAYQREREEMAKASKHKKHARNSAGKV